MTERRHPLRRTSVVIAAYALAGLAWIGVAHLIGPRIVTSAYEGRSLPILNQLFAPPVALEYYLDRWATFSGGVLLAGLLHLCLVLLILRSDRRLGSPVAPQRDQQSVASVTLVLFSLAFLGATVVSGARQDYIVHLMIWEWTLQGDDPWTLRLGGAGPVNAYGPLFNALAPLILINPFAPKLVFAACYLTFVIWLLKNFPHQRGRGGLSRFAVVAWIVNPLPWIEVAYFGHFDILVGLLCVAAIHTRLRSSDSASGVYLGFGVLLKFLPVVILPFLVVDRNRFRLRLLFTAAITIVLGAAATLLTWGPSVVGAISSTATRPPELLSIFRFLRGEWSPLRPFLDAAAVDALAIPCLAVAGLLVFAWCWLRSIDAAKGAVLAVLVTVMFYSVGFIQYRFLLFVLISYWFWTTGADSPSDDGFLRVALTAYFGCLAAFDAFYAAIGGVIVAETPWRWIPEVAGAPAFVLECVLLAAVLRSTRRPALGSTVQPLAAEVG